MYLMGVGCDPILCMKICEPYWSAPSPSNPVGSSKRDPSTTTLWERRPTSALNEIDR